VLLGNYRTWRSGPGKCAWVRGARALPQCETLPLGCICPSPAFPGEGKSPLPALRKIKPPPCPASIPSPAFSPTCLHVPSLLDVVFGRSCLQSLLWQVSMGSPSQRLKPGWAGPIKPQGRGTHSGSPSSKRKARVNVVPAIALAAKGSA